MAWGRGGLPAAIRAPVTPEQEKRNREAARQRELDAAQASLMALAATIRDQVEACFRKPGGYAPDYHSDDQYSLDKSYSRVAVAIGYELWKDLYHPGRLISLNVHMMGPSPKLSGGRGGQVQANFIRKKEVGKEGRYNVHINISD